MDEIDKRFQAALRIQKHYTCIAAPWIRQLEITGQVLAPSYHMQKLGVYFPHQLQISLKQREKWLNKTNYTTELIQPLHTLVNKQIEMIAILQSMAKTPELLWLENKLLLNDLSVTGEYIKNITLAWNRALDKTDIFERSIAAQNIAVLRMMPDYRKLLLPRKGKKVISGLTKSAAQKVMQTDELLFDPKHGDFFYKDFPEKKVSSNKISVAESSIELFEEISFSDLVDFESLLYDDVTFAVEHPVGSKIYEIIKKWNTFIHFDRSTYFHARALGDNGQSYLNQEMLKAPRNVSCHGRYNAIGKACYYFSDSKSGAVSEIRKHAGNKKPVIQVAEIKPVKSICMIDLSIKVSSKNKFMEHMRYAVDNEEGKIVKQYLLPNYVASCCKKLGIEGIKYLSGDYVCYVTWKDDYFTFVNQEIVNP